MKPIYLDYNATTPIDKEVAAAMRPFLDEYFGNPSSSHSYGKKTRIAVENARTQVAGLLECDTDEIVFTSGGTESNNWAIKGAALANKNRGNHIITSVIEHPAVTEVCKHLENNGFRISYVPVDEYGIVKVEDITKFISPETTLITIMHANNEVGSIQPIAEISQIAKENGIIFHTDAAQSTGKISVITKKLGVDLLSIAGHKLYAPKGVGALYIRHGIHLEKLMHGANHEHDLRAGTENILEIVGLGKACEIAKSKLEENRQYLTYLRERLFNGLSLQIKNIRLNGHPTKRLPNTLSVSFADIEAEALLSQTDQIAASAGAACHAGNIKISSVLKAMNIPENYAIGTIRFSVGTHTSVEDIDTAIKIIKEAVFRLTAG